MQNMQLDLNGLHSGQSVKSEFAVKGDSKCVWSYGILLMKETV